MSKKIRESTPDDQEKTQKTCDLVVELLKLNPQIETNIWISACWCLIIECCWSNGYSYERLCEEQQQAFRFYKHLWEETP